MTSKKEMSPFSSSDSSSEEELYLIERIADERRLRNGKTQYLIKWEGYHSIHNTWEDSKEIRRSAMDAVTEWEEEKKKRPRSSGLRKGRGKRVSTCLCSGDCGEKKIKVESQTSSQKGHQKWEINSGEMSSNGFEPFPGFQKSPLPDNCKKERRDVDFVNRFEGQVNNLKSMVIQNYDKQLKAAQEAVRHAEAPLRQEVGDLKEANGKMLESMTNLDLFMMHRKDKEELLQNEIMELKSQLKANELKYQAINETAVRRLAKIEELQTQSNKMRRTLASVADFFSDYMGFLVTPGFVSFFLPHVKHKAMQNSAKAEQLEKFRKMLKE